MLPDWFFASVLVLRSVFFLWLGALCWLAGCSAVPSPTAKVYRCELVNIFQWTYRNGPVPKQALSQIQRHKGETAIDPVGYIA